VGQNFIRCDREQAFLLPPDVRDWLPAEHLARFVIAVVEQLDLSVIYGRYRSDGHGRAAYEPAAMTALLLYSYAVGVRSSRAIERRCVEDVASRVLIAQHRPDHATIARFRADHQDALSGLLLDVLALCRQAGMVRLGTVAIDSTKLAANASADANRTHDQLRAEAERILGEAAATDAREDELFGDRRGDELPDDLADPAGRPARIRELLEAARARREAIEREREEMQVRRVEHRARTGRAPVGRPPGARPSVKQRRALEQKYNLTDPDSGVVRHRGMLMQGYNVQTAVADGQIIVAIRATGTSPDQGQLAPTLAAAQANLARIGATDRIEEVLADSGYWHGDQIDAVQARGIRVLVPPTINPKVRPDKLQRRARQMRAVLATDDGQRAYRRRQQIVEPVFAHIKHHRHITRLLRRGRQAVQAELDLIATTHNLLKLYRHHAAAIA
jgi:transposase